jgi:hypothetical protein
MSIDDRHRDKTGEISRKHGNTLVSTLRKIYGPSFAAGEPDSAKLGQRFRGSNHIRRPLRVCRTKCG